MTEPKPGQDRYTEEEWKVIMDGLDKEEREIMEAFERGEMEPLGNTDEMIEALRNAARNTLTEPREMKVRVRELLARLVEQRAQELGVTCDDVFATAIEEYLSRLLIPDQQTEHQDKVKPLPCSR